MAIKKKVKEKATGEKYASKTAMAKHEKKESKAEMKKEYGYVKSPAKQTTAGDWKNKTTDTTVLANRKAADAKQKINQANAAKTASAQAAKTSSDTASKYNKAKAISTSKDKANDVMYGSWTNRQKADRTLKELNASGYKPAANTTAKPAAKPTAKPMAKPAAKANSYETANKGGAMDKLVKARNSAAKGSREYAAAQNQINAALGSKVRHSAKKEVSVSSIKPAEAKKATITVTTPAKMKKKC